MTEGNGKVTMNDDEWLADRFESHRTHLQPALINGAVGVITIADGQPVSVMAFTISHGQIVEIDLLADA